MERVRWGTGRRNSRRIEGHGQEVDDRGKWNKEGDDEKHDNYRRLNKKEKNGR